VTRLLSDRHYTTDIIAGMGVGFAFGYLVPVLLHYERKQSKVTVTLQPDVLDAGASLSVSGAF
jgi:membrane-associated phospholipid phosphatase